MAKKAQASLFVKAAERFIPNGRENAMPAANGIPSLRKNRAEKGSPILRLKEKGACLNLFRSAARRKL